MITWAEHLFSFYKNLKPPAQLSGGIDWLYPQQSTEVLVVVQAFLEKYYADTAPRRLLLGINPGRFGAGVTGVNFTAAKQLTEECQLLHPFKAGSELSAEFIYAVVNAYGGPAAFYKNFFIGSVCPLGFVKGGKNINYYDDKQLLAAAEPFIIKSLTELLAFPFLRDRCFCIGEEKNFRYLSKLNAQHGWFESIVPLPHPRFIMQYRRKQVPEYVDRYIRLLGE
ncbi:MAG: uracil-DNA glycosylase family protein [Chitinophagaceae bacterium]